MRWGDYIKRTAVRRVVWIVVGLVAYGLLSGLGFVGKAHAQAVWCGTNTSNLQDESCTLPVAAQQCQAALAATMAYWKGRHPHRDYQAFRDCSLTGGSYQTGGTLSCVVRALGVAQHDCGPPDDPGRSINPFFIFQGGCPDGEWRDDLGRCFDPSECVARNQQPGFGVPTTRAWQSKCVDGCQLRFDPNQGSVCASLGGSMFCSGSLEWSGEQCDVPPGADPEDDPPTRPDKATCTPAGDGQSFCIKPTGEHCYTASNGRQVCWQPNETGEKVDRNTLQKRNPGPTEIPPPNPNLPTGDVLEKAGESITTTTTRNQGNTSTTTTTTTTNYETQYGTNPKPGAGDQGEPGDGSGAEGGEGDDDSGSIDGGGDCDTPPVGRGGDAQVVAVVNQAWATRCAVEAGNAAKVTGDVGDCSAPFTVEGDNANAHQLRALRAKICGDYERAEAERTEREGISAGLDVEIASLESEYPVEGVWGDGEGDGGAGIVTNRYGTGGSCPVLEVTIPVINRTWTPPPAFCNLIAALRLLFITVATVWALRIIGD